MKLGWIRRKFHRYSEAGHEATLALAAIAAIAALLGSVVLDAPLEN